MLLEEGVRLFEVLAVQQAMKQALVILRAEYTRPDIPADRVVDGVTGNRRDDQQRHDQPDVEHAGGGERAGREQQRIARQERPDHQARLDEDDREQDHVDHHPVLGDEGGEVNVEVEKQIDEVSHSRQGSYPDENHRPTRITSLASRQVDSRYTA